MKTLIDDMTAVGSWAADAGSGITLSVNQHPTLCAERLASSLVVAFPTGSSGKGIQRTVSVDVSTMTDVVFSVWSRNLRGTSFRYPTDFSYTITLTLDGVDYSWYFPTFEAFDQVDITLPAGALSLTKVRIEAQTDVADWIVLSDLCAVYDEFPADVLQAVVDEVAWARDLLIGASGKGILLGTVNATTGDLSIAFDWTHPYLERWGIITIDDGTNSETHQIDVDAEATKGFFSTYDGPAIKHNYTAANVYLQIPVELDRFQIEMASPVIAVSSMVPEPFPLTSEVATVEDSFSTSSGPNQRREPMQVKYTVLIACQARQQQIMALASRIVRYALGQNRLWVNARAHDFQFDQVPTAEEPESVDLESSVVYSLEVRVKEERDQRAQPVLATAGTATATAVAGSVS